MWANFFATSGALQSPHATGADSIAEQHRGWDVDELAFYNGLDSDEPLRPGSLLKIPRRTPLPKFRHPAPKPWEKKEPARAE